MVKNSYKNTVYSIAALIMLVECLTVEFITESFIAFIVVAIVDLNLAFLLWRLDRIGEDFDEYDEE